MTGSRAAAFAIALSAALALSAPAFAQFDIDYPDTPPAEGQTMLEWARPPVLDYTIPADKRGDLSTCAEDRETELERVAATCWPVLQTLKLYTLASFAENEPVGDKATNWRAAIAHAEELIELVGTPRWPMEELLRTKALEIRLSALRGLGEWDAALDASGALIASIRDDMVQHDDFRLGFAHRKRGEILIKLGQSEAARADLDRAWTLFDGDDRDMVGWPLSNYSEAVIADAIRSGDLEYAKQAADRFLDLIRTAPSNMQFGITDHIDLKLYLLAIEGDANGALTLIAERVETGSPYSKCTAGPFRFPQVLAPLRQDARILNALRELGCRDKQLAEMDFAADQGIRSRRGDLILPPPSGE
ncbi:hypothetical protein [Erythrobacter sp. MTPC3]|uniref:hypothetical protein n=1 Tax=Erythrobacter sp. MTPC3 TaxID=3056564 RepID=UPI0036F2330F